MVKYKKNRRIEGDYDPAAQSGGKSVRAICVDDEKLIMEDTLAMCTDLPQISDVKGFTLRVRPERFTCDAYLFFAGNADMVNAYRGEYMNSYSWASMTENLMYRKAVEKK